MSVCYVTHPLPRGGTDLTSLEELNRHFAYLNRMNNKTSGDLDNESFAEIAAASISRRGFVKAGLAATGTVCFGEVESLLNAVAAVAFRPHGTLLGFKRIPVSSADTVIVPEGYSVNVLIAWGDPVSD